MSGPYKDQAVLLHRDTLSLAWGFRLQGGKDFKAPLTIQRVFVGSPADGVVHRGDVLVSIENHDTVNLAHKQAQDLIKQAGGSLRMHVRRLEGTPIKNYREKVKEAGGRLRMHVGRLKKGGGNIYGASRPAPTPVPQRSTTPHGTYIGPGKPGPIPTAGALAFLPKPSAPKMPTNPNAMTFGTDYSKKVVFKKTVPGGPPPMGNMLTRVNNSLNAALWQPGGAPEDYEYDPAYRPVHDLRKTFNQQAQSQQPYHSYNRAKSGSGSSYRRQMSTPQAPVAPSFVTPSHQPARATSQQQQQHPMTTYVTVPSNNNEEDEEYSQKSIRELMGVFTEKKARLAADHQYEEEQEYEPLPVKELKKKFNKKEGKGKKPVRLRAARDAAPPQIQIPDYAATEEANLRNRTGKQWTPPDPSMYPSKPLYEPGWSPKQPPKPEPQQQPAQGVGGWGPVRPAQQQGLPAPPCSPQPQRSPGYQVPRVQEPDYPAWAGSLSSGGGVRPWEITSPRHSTGQNTMAAPQQQQEPRRRSPQPQAQQPQRSPRRREPAAPAPAPIQPHQPRVQTVNYGPGGEQTYAQQDPNKYGGDAKIAHLQYNTPLGLYSRDNVEESLTGQTAGGAGEGTMQVTGGGPPGQKVFDPKQSSVLRMLQEQEGLGRQAPRQAPPPQQPQQSLAQQQRPTADQSARYQVHSQGQEMQYQGYMDHYKQSPSMHALEYNMSDMRIEEASGTGTSDF